MGCLGLGGQIHIGAGACLWTSRWVIPVRTQLDCSDVRDEDVLASPKTRLMCCERRYIIVMYRDGSPGSNRSSG